MEPREITGNRSLPDLQRASTVPAFSRIITVTSSEKSASLEQLPHHAIPASPLSKHRFRLLSQESRSRSMTDVRTGHKSSSRLYQQKKTESRFLPSCQAKFRRSPLVIQKTPRSSPDLSRPPSNSPSAKRFQSVDEDRGLDNAKSVRSHRRNKSDFSVCLNTCSGPGSVIQTTGLCDGDNDLTNLSIPDASLSASESTDEDDADVIAANIRSKHVASFGGRRRNHSESEVTAASCMDVTDTTDSFYPLYKTVGCVPKHGSLESLTLTDKTQSCSDFLPGSLEAPEMSVGSAEWCTASLNVSRSDSMEHLHCLGSRRRSDSLDSEDFSLNISWSSDLSHSLRVRSSCSVGSTDFMSSDASLCEDLPSKDLKLIQESVPTHHPCLQTQESIPTTRHGNYGHANTELSTSFDSVPSEGCSQPHFVPVKHSSNADGACADYKTSNKNQPGLVCSQQSPGSNKQSPVSGSPKSSSVLLPHLQKTLDAVRKHIKCKKASSSSKIPVRVKQISPRRRERQSQGRSRHRSGSSASPTKHLSPRKQQHTTEPNAGDAKPVDRNDSTTGGDCLRYNKEFIFSPRPPRIVVHESLSLPKDDHNQRLSGESSSSSTNVEYVKSLKQETKQEISRKPPRRDDLHPKRRSHSPRTNSGGISPRNQRRKHSSRVDYILNNDLFRKHLSGKIDLVEKNILRIKKLGLKKSFSNIDLTKTESARLHEAFESSLKLQSEGQTPVQQEQSDTGNGIGSVQDVDVIHLHGTSSTSRNQCVKPNDCTSNPRRKSLACDDPSLLQLQRALCQSPGRPDSTHADGKRGRLHIPSFDEFRKHRPKTGGHGQSSSLDVANSSASAGTYEDAVLNDRTLGTITETDDTDTARSSTNISNVHLLRPERTEIIQQEQIASRAHSPIIQSEKHGTVDSTKLTKSSLDRKRHQNSHPRAVSSPGTKRTSGELATGVQHRLTVPSHFVPTMSSLKDDAVTVPPEGPTAIEEHHRVHVRGTDWNPETRTDRKARNKKTAGSVTKQSQSSQDPQENKKHKSGAASGGTWINTRSDREETSCDIGQGAGGPVKRFAGDKFTDALFNEKAVAMDTEAWAQLFTRVYSPRKNTGKKKQCRYALKSEKTSTVAVLRSSSDVTCGQSSSGGSGQRQRRHRKERPYKSDPLAEGAAGVTTMGLHSNVKSNNNNNNKVNNNNSINSNRNRQTADAEDVEVFLQEGDITRDSQASSFPSLEELEELTEESCNSEDSESDKKTTADQHYRTRWSSTSSYASVDSGVMGHEIVVEEQPPGPLSPQPLPSLPPQSDLSLPPQTGLSLRLQCDVPGGSRQGIEERGFSDKGLDMASSLPSRSIPSSLWRRQDGEECLRDTVEPKVLCGGLASGLQPSRSLDTAWPGLVHQQAISCVECKPEEGQAVRAVEAEDPGLCDKCLHRQQERKETIYEIIETEINYGRDLRILKEEFYVPMKTTGLLTSEQLDTVFVNLDDLLTVNTQLTERLRSALHAAAKSCDQELNCVNIGSIFAESSTMFLVFENYCINQAQASASLEQLERERELLRIFLQVSQTDNSVLRRMHLKSFLMVPVQRIMKYPLLLNRLYKATPSHHSDKENIRQAREKIEDILGHINAKAKASAGSVRIKRKQSEMHRYSLTEKIEVNRVALEVLGWSQKEAVDLITSRMWYAQPSDHTWASKRCRNIKFSSVHAVLLTYCQNHCQKEMHQNQNNNNVVLGQQAAVVLVREKGGKYQPVRDPFFLEKSVVTVDPECDEVFELQEWGREAYIFKAEDVSETRQWVQHLRQQTSNLGQWRRRRNAMPNIMLKNK